MSIDNSRLKREREEHKKIKYISFESDNKDGNTELTPKSKHGGGQQVGKFLIKPLSNRKRKRSIDDDDLNLLRNMFGTNGDGVSMVDSREYTYDSQGGWH
jgi:hypothetical protein